MMPSTTIPITVEPAAAARVRELGLEQDLERMLDHLTHHVPGLRSIEVRLDAEVNMWDYASIILETHQDDPGKEDIERDEWTAWLAATFSGDSLRHFVRDYVYEEVPHGR